MEVPPFESTEEVSERRRSSWTLPKADRDALRRQTLALRRQANRSIRHRREEIFLLEPGDDSRHRDVRDAHVLREVLHAALSSLMDDVRDLPGDLARRL